MTNDKNTSRRFTRKLTRMALVLPLMSVILVTSVWVTQDYIQFREMVRTNRSTMLKEHKILVRSQVNRALDFIEYQQQSIWEQQRNRVKDRANQVWHIARDLMARYRDKPEVEMKWALYQIMSSLSWNLGGSIFALNKAGMVTAHSLKTKDSHPLSSWAGGNESVSLVLKLLRVAQKHGEGFVRYSSPESREDSMGPKLFYVREFEPLGWIIGAEIEASRVTARIQQAVLDRLESITFAQGTGYLFINAYGGVPMLNPNNPEIVGKNLWDITDENGVKVIQEIEAAARQSQGGFVSYVWDKPSQEEPVGKISFVRGVDEWGWAVGGGIYLDDIDAAIAARRDELQSAFLIRLGLMLATMLVLSLLGVWLGRRLSAKLTSQFEHFQDEFSSSYQKERPLDIRVFDYAEFRGLGRQINRIQRALHESEERYQSLIQQLPVGLYRNTPGPRGRFTLANPSMAEMFGYDCVDSFLQCSVADLYADSEERAAFSKTLLTEGAVTRRELRLRRKDGRIIWGAVTARIVREESGKILYFDGLIEDITLRKEQEGRLRQTLAETERMNRLMHGRETRVLEMKEEVNRLRADLGRPLKYKSVAEDVKEVEEVHGSRSRIKKTDQILDPASPKG
ncbi:MAG: cache domain-containing protein [Desulfohalobiaceae bacterium]|nr:cache domain-containing protein [Desulfohalobiaceae bacterium]